MISCVLHLHIFFRQFSFAGLRRWLVGICCCIACLHTNASTAGEARIAVAANFYSSASALAQAFKQYSSHTLKLSTASTGKLAIQIMHGAPFDVFLAADTRRPQRLIKQGFAIAPASTYAIGQLALFSKAIRLDQLGSSVLLDGSILRIALANPESAPYGLAAQQFLNSLHLDNKIIRVTGDNVSQALQFADTGNVDAAFVSLGQAKATQGYYTVINSDKITPIKQQAVLLKRAQKNAAALEFLAFLHSSVAKKIITDHGYLTE